MIASFSVVGLGRLGAAMAAAIASRGHEVIGVDVNGKVASALNWGRAPVHETGLQALIDENRDRLTATSSHAEAVSRSDATFVVVPTPSDERGGFRLDYVASAFEAIGKGLAEKQGYHLVVLTSTVLPGSTRQRLLPVLERAAGKRCGPDFGLCYSPEFIALGSVLSDFLSPDFTLIGEFDRFAGDQLETIYGSIMLNHPPARRMSLENAELAKIAINTFVTTKIAFANMLADLCERIPGGDVDAVSDTLGLDSRIGRKYLTGGLGYGGPCFPRDNAALSFMARKLGSRARIADTTNHVNQEWAERIFCRIRDLVEPGMTVAVLGLAYKPFSNVVEASQGLDLARRLSELGVKVVAHDTLAGDTCRAELDGRVQVVSSPLECVAEADLAVVTLPDPAFGSLEPADFGGRPPVTVIDCWRTLQGQLKGHPGVRYLAVGQSIDDGVE